jgi:hypothetical protein
MLGFNETGVIYGILQGWTAQTGSMFLTLFIILLLIMIAFAITGLGIEASAIIILPLMLGLMAAYSAFYTIGGILLIYLGIILAKNYFFKW